MRGSEIADCVDCRPFRNPKWSTMNLLFVADIMGRPGRRAAAVLIPQLRKVYGVCLCIVNGENAAGGAGITEKIAQELYACGVDVITTGNHVWDQKEAVPYIQRATRLLRPANYPPEVGGIGSGMFETAEGGLVGVINLQGRTFMGALDCPFRVAEREIEKLGTKVTVVDFHAEATSEKMAMGWYLDGRVSAVIGTHVHVQTADERILPKGTAYITDVGMTGPHDSVIGVECEVALKRFLTQMPVKFTPAKVNVKLCGVVLEVDEETGRARRIQRLRVDYNGA